MIPVLATVGLVAAALVALWLVLWASDCLPSGGTTPPPPSDEWMRKREAELRAVGRDDLI